MTPGADARQRPDDGPRVPRASRPPSAPARPDLGGQGFAATMDVGGPPAALTVSVVLWLVGSAVALVAAGILWQGQDAVRGRLAAAAAQQDPSVAADVLADTARYAFWAAAGAVALVAVVHALLAVLMRTGRTWAHTLLVITGAVGIAVAVAVQDLVADPARDVLSDPARTLLAGQVAAVVGALVAMLLPSARRWLRRVRALRG
jgi:hypothetical protein